MNIHFDLRVAPQVSQSILGGLGGLWIYKDLGEQI